MYVKGTEDKTTDGSTTTYSQCNRSGVFQSNGTGKTRLRNQGFSKISNQTNGESHHAVGESRSVLHALWRPNYRLGHFRLGVQVRLQIVGKLAHNSTKY